VADNEEVDNGVAHDGEHDLHAPGFDAAETALDDVDAFEAGPAGTADVAGSADRERDTVDITDGATASAAGNDLDVFVR